MRIATAAVARSPFPNYSILSSHFLRFYIHNYINYTKNTTNTATSFITSSNKTRNDNVVVVDNVDNADFDAKDTHPLLGLLVSLQERLVQQAAFPAKRPRNEAANSSPEPANSTTYLCDPNSNFHAKQQDVRLPVSMRVTSRS